MQILQDPALSFDAFPTVIYEVPSDLLDELDIGRQLHGRHSLYERELVAFLQASVRLLASVSAAKVREHLATCVDGLRAPSTDIVKRELIGEILAAVAVLRAYPRLTMVKGYQGGGTGLDQLWISPEEDVVGVVEAKGGRATPDTRERHFDGTTHQAEYLGKATQMSAAWVFIGCNKLILGDRFTAAMAWHRPTGRILDLVRPRIAPYPRPSAERTAMLVCFALWNPGQRATTGRNPFRVENDGVVPSVDLNAAMAWQPGQQVLLPRVIGMVIQSGDITSFEEYVAARGVVAERDPAGGLPGGRGRVRGKGGWDGGGAGAPF